MRPGLAATSTPRGAARFLHPGDVACARQGERLETLLGSCVAIVLTDPRRTVGAMCHIVHAGRAAGGAPESTAYACAALTTMFSMLRACAIDPHQCEAYVYGGGNMFPDQFPASHVGEHNVCWVFDELGRNKVQVVGHDVGGSRYRKLSWTIGPGAPRVTAVAV